MTDEYNRGRRQKVALGWVARFGGSTFRIREGTVWRLRGTKKTISPITVQQLRDKGLLVTAVSCRDWEQLDVASKAASMLRRSQRPMAEAAE